MPARTTLAAVIFVTAIVTIHLGTGTALAQTQSQPNPAPQTAAATGSQGAASAGASAATGTDDIPVNVRLRRLEQQVQALKERAWRTKARVSMLKDAVLGGGLGANATVVHVNNMGSSYRLVQLVYAIDGTQVFSKTDSGEELHKNKEIEVLSGPIAPGSHTISVLAVYRGHGYGVFKYLNKYKFSVRSSHTFTASEGKSIRIEAVALERGGATTPLDQRPAMEFKVSDLSAPGGSATTRVNTSADK